MRIQYRGRQKGWRIYLKKGGIQIDLGGKSPSLHFPVSGIAVWDDRKNGFMFISQYFIDGRLRCVSGFNQFPQNPDENSVSMKEIIYYVDPELTGLCNNEQTCEAVKEYLKEARP